MEARDFGSYLRSLRKRKSKKLTIRQLGAYSGVSNSYISQIERGERGVPSPDVLLKLAKPLGVSYEELMTHAGYINSPSNKLIINELEVDIGDPGTPERETFTKLFLKDFYELPDETQKQIHELIKTWKPIKKDNE
ncbi:helix-turn-helix domain-containing protein [Paenibacillus sp. MMO-58]|uniref:helix-turn-helix domain-containing protein n=1 Tax=Paenibacillus sp. MMO-58 TaxID=3081290 RepID=UPI00301851B5